MCKRPRDDPFSSVDDERAGKKWRRTIVPKRQRESSFSSTEDEAKPWKKCRVEATSADTNMGAIVPYYSQSNDYCDDDEDDDDLFVESLGKDYGSESLQIANLWRKAVSTLYPSAILRSNYLPSVVNCFHAAVKYYMTSNRLDEVAHGFQKLVKKRKNKQEVLNNYCTDLIPAHQETGMVY